MFSGQVALVADAVTFTGRQLFWVHDVLIVTCCSLAMGIHVLPTRAMAPFAADTGFLERLGGVVTARVIVKEVNLADVTGQAGLTHQAFEPLVSRRDITGGQVPCLILDVPGDWGLVKTVLVLGKVGSATRSGTNHEGNGNRLIVNVLAIFIDHFLVVPGKLLGILVAGPCDTVASTTASKRGVLLVILDRGRFGWPAHRVGHGMVLIGLVDICMAFGTTLASHKAFMMVFFCRGLVPRIERLLAGVVRLEEPGQQAGQDEESTNQPEQGAGEIASPLIWYYCHDLDKKMFLEKRFFQWWPAARQPASCATVYGLCLWRANLIYREPARERLHYSSRY